MNGQITEKIYSNNSYSRYYDLFFGSILQSGRQLAVEALEIAAGDHILEIGTGTALMAPHYPPYCRITGIDLSEKMLRKGRQRISRLALKNFDLSQMDATHVAFADREFDKVLAAYFLTVVRDPLAAIAEMKRVCRRGGYILFINHFMSSNPILAGFEKLVSPLSKRIGFHTDVSYEALIEESNLILDRVIPVPPTGIWKAVRCFNP